jgi:hypothetical protein
VNRFLVLATGFVAGAGTVIVGEAVAQVVNEGTATLECKGDFSEGGQLDCTIHDLVTVPGTTTPPTTRATTTTTHTTTSTTISTSTTIPPPTGVAFFEDFTGDDMSSFTQRFDWSVADLGFSRSTAPWQGHHNMACEGPETERNLVHGPVSNTDPGAEFWMCGPGGPTTDHLMTSNGSNNVFGVTAFSPKQSFTARRVCWDVNLTESFGRRLWWEVQILPANYVANAIGMLEMGTINGSSSERGTAYLAWGAGVDATLVNRVVPQGGLIWDFTEEKVQIWRGREPNPNRGWGSEPAQVIFNPGNGWEPGVRYVTKDRATRAHHCWIDNGDGTMTIGQQRPGQAEYVRTIRGSFPQPFRVIFQAHNYNAGKDGTASNQTWHWDNILVAAR